MKEFFQKSIYLLLTFLSFFAININVNYFGDDFSYLKWTKLSAVEYLERVGKHYIYTNGRTIVHVLDSLFLKLNPIFWAIFNSLMLVGICYFAAKIIVRKNENKMPLAFSVMFFFVSILDILVTRQSVYWITGSFNYVYPICMFFIYWYYLLKIAESKKNFICAIIFGILGSASVEQMGMMTFGITVLTMLSKVKSIKEITKKNGIKELFQKNKRIVWMLIITFVGLASVLLAPGQFVRINQESKYSRLYILFASTRWLMESFTTGDRALIYAIVINAIVALYGIHDDKDKSKKVFLSITLNLIATISINLSGIFNLVVWKLIFMLVILLTYVYEIIYLNSKFENKLFSMFINAIILMVGSQFMMVVSNVIGERNLLPGYVMYAFVISYALTNLVLPKYLNEKALVICLIVVGMLFNVRTACGYYVSKTIWDENMQTIEQHKDDKVITLKKFEDTNYSWSALYESEDHEKYFKSFYNIDAEFNWID